MMDVLYVASIVAFFALTAGLVGFCADPTNPRFLRTEVGVGYRWLVD